MYKKEQFEKKPIKVPTNHQILDKYRGRRR